MGWFSDNGYDPAIDQQRAAQGMSNIPTPQESAQLGAPTQAPPVQPPFNGGIAGSAPPLPPATVQQVGHNDTASTGLTREQYRDKWQSSGATSMADLQKFVAEHGGTIDSGNGTVTTPYGEQIDMLINARGSAAGNGPAKAGWGASAGMLGADPTGGAGGGDPNARGTGWQGGPITNLSTGGQYGGLNPGGGSYGPNGYNSGGQVYAGSNGQALTNTHQYTGDNFGYTPMGMPADFQQPNTQAQPFSYGQAVPNYNPMAAPENYTPGQISAPERPVVDRLTPQGVQNQTIGAPERVNAQSITAQQVGMPSDITQSQISRPGSLSAQQLDNGTGYQGLTADQLSADPSYQFRLKQGLGAMQNSAAARGTLLTGGTLKGLQDYAGQSASQEYAAADARARQTYNDTYAQRANTTGQNNAANAQAYGLTNQYQQNADLANQSNSFNTQQANVSNRLNAGQFNAQQANSMGAQNAANALQAGQFNASLGTQVNTQNAANANQMGQFNAGQSLMAQGQNASNQLAAYNAYQPLAQQAQSQNIANATAANQQNFGNQFAVNQANNQGALAAQNQGFNQATSAYGQNLAALGQNYGQLANTQSMNVGNALAANQQQYNQSVGAWQGNVNAQLGYGGLQNQQQQAQNAYSLGQGNLQLGQQNFGLNQQGQNWNQAFSNNQQQWNQYYQMAQLGYPTS